MGPSFGHLVRDTFTIFAANLRDLSLDWRKYKFLVIKQSRPWKDPHHVLEKYAPWRSDGMILLRDLERSEETSVCARHIVFRDIVVSTLFFNSTPAISHVGEVPVKRWGGCGTHVFRSHRVAAYKVAGMWPIQPVSELAQIRVVFGDKAEDDNRRIANLGELLPALRLRFPSMLIESLLLSNMTIYQQLQTLSTTSIFISTQVRILSCTSCTSMLCVATLYGVVHGDEWFFLLAEVSARSPKTLFILII